MRITASDVGRFVLRKRGKGGERNWQKKTKEYEESEVTGIHDSLCTCQSRCAHAWSQDVPSCAQLNINSLPHAFFSAGTHCALARIPVVAPQHFSFQFRLCFCPVISHRSVIGHSCSTVPLNISLVRTPRCATVQTRFHPALLTLAHKGHYIHFLLERIDVRRCCATSCTSCCASRHIWT